MFPIIIITVVGKIQESAGPDVALLKFCSATYRLIKPMKPLEDLSKKDSTTTTVQVKYNGISLFYICIYRFLHCTTVEPCLTDTPQQRTLAIRRTVQKVPNVSS